MQPDRMEPTGSAEARPRFYPQLLLAALWVLSAVILLLQDRNTAWIAIGFGAFMLALWLVTKRLVPESLVSEPTVLVAVGSRKRLVARVLLVAAAIAVTFVHLFAVNHVLTLPAFESVLQGIARLAPSLGSGLPTSSCLFSSQECWWWRWERAARNSG